MKINILTVKYKPLVCLTNNLSVELINDIFTGRIHIVRKKQHL